ncbi:DUF2267 domain-containing protein [Legionella israelensis]|nr:DUF2267 domain-containing protein [Legionella israelensis]
MRHVLSLVKESEQEERIMQISSITSSVNKTYEWLHECRDFGHFRDESQCYSVLRVVLHSLRDELPPEISAHLASQLPLVLKGVYYEGWNPSHPISKAKALEEFIEPFSTELNQLNVNTKEAVTACMKFIKHKLGPDLAEKVMSSLPTSLRKEFN